MNSEFLSGQHKENYVDEFLNYDSTTNLVAWFLRSCLITDINSELGLVNRLLSYV